MAPRKLALLLLAAALLAAAAFASQARRVRLTASCGPGCDPAPVPFSVPQGHAAERFVVLRMVPGRPCARGEEAKLSGFSIRKGGAAVFVYYPGPRGLVTDPVPLEDLVLGPGAYALLAAPADGATVTLEFDLSAQP